MNAGLTGQQAAQRNCYLTTTGRVTGRPHEIEIWFAIDPDRNDGTIYLLSGGRERADWVRNIRRHREVRVRVGDVTLRGTARIVDPDDPADLRARQALARKYQEWDEGRELSPWARESLPVAIELDGAPGG